MLTRVLLVHGTGNAGERSVGIGADQTHRTDHQHQYHGQHDRVLGNVLSLLVRPQISAKLKHADLQAFVSGGTESSQGVIMPTPVAIVNQSPALIFTGFPPCQLESDAYAARA